MKWKITLGVISENNYNSNRIIIGYSLIKKTN